MRPTTDKVRSAVFSVLFDRVEDAEVLDLFCGTGSYGLEALSRGAKSAVFADTDVTYVKKNLNGLEEEFMTEVIKGDVFKSLPRARRFDIIFIDPPYGQYTADELLTLVKNSELLANDGVIVYEESIRTEFKISAEGWTLENEKRYGDTIIRYISLADGDL